MGQGFGSKFPHPPPRPPSRGGHAIQDEPTNQEPSKLPPVLPPPRKIGSVPEMAIYSGMSTQNGAGPSPRPLPPVSAPPGRASLPGGSLPPPIPPPRKTSSSFIPSPPVSADSLAITKMKERAPSAPDTMREESAFEVEAEPLDWEEDEESTHVYGNGNGLASSPPSAPRAPFAPPPSSSQMFPPPPRNATLLGVGERREPNIKPPSIRGVSVAPELGDDLATTTHRGDSTIRLESPMSSNGNGAPSSQNYQAAPPYSQPPSFPSQYATNGARVHALQQPVPPQPISSRQATDEPLVRLPTARPGTATEMAAPRVEEPDRSRRTLFLVAAGTAILTALIAGGFMFTQRPGSLEVEVKDVGGKSLPVAEVYIDGTKVCGATPCIVRELSPGTKAVRVIAEGFSNDEPVNAEVHAGEANRVTVLLKTSQGVLAATSDQAGVRIVVDGTDRGPLPVRLQDLAPGAHQLRFVGGDRYKTLERAVEVKAGENIDVGNIRLAVAKGKMVVSVKTEDAKIFLVPNDDMARAKVLEGPFPRAIEVDTSSGPWKLVARKKGLVDFVSPLDFSDGVAEKSLEVLLKEEPVIASNEPTPEPVRGDPPVSTGPRPTTRDTPPDPKPEPAEAKGMGTLNINSLPVSRILLDGQPMGETPRTGLSVTAGTHTVTFVHSEYGKKSVTVKVEAGKTAVASARLKTD